MGRIGAFLFSGYVINQSYILLLRWFTFPTWYFSGLHSWSPSELKVRIKVLALMNKISVDKWEFRKIMWYGNRWRDLQSDSFWELHAVCLKKPQKHGILKKCYPLPRRIFFSFILLHFIHRWREKNWFNLTQHLDTLPNLTFVLNNSFMNITLKLTFWNCFSLVNIFSNFLPEHFKLNCRREGM